MLCPYTRRLHYLVIHSVGKFQLNIAVEGKGICPCDRMEIYKGAVR